MTHQTKCRRFCVMNYCFIIRLIFVAWLGLHSELCDARSKFSKMLNQELLKLIRKTDCSRIKILEALKVYFVA